MLSLLCLLTVLLGSKAWAVDFTATFSDHVGEVFQTFTLTDDSEVTLFSTLSNGASCANTGFGILSADRKTTVVRPGSAPCTAGAKSGPWALKAGSYAFQFYHNGSGGSYLAQMVSSSSSYANDSESNDSAATAQGMAYDGGNVTGHMGYGNGLSTDGGDYYRITVPNNGALTVTLTTDATMPAGSRGYALYASDGNSVVRDLSLLTPGVYYIGLYVDTYYAQAYGGYRLTTSFKSATGNSALTANPSSLNFGEQALGSTSSSQTVTLSNSGTSAVTISSITTSGDFSVSHNCPASLAVASTCTVSASFTPSAIGARSGAIIVTSNANLGSLALSGTGVASSSWAINDINQVSNPQVANFNLMFIPRSADRNGTQQLYVAAIYNGQLYFLTLDGANLKIAPYSGGNIPAYSSSNGSVLANQTWYIGLGDLSSLRGLQIYAGFGRDASDMLLTGQFKLILSVP